MASWHAVVSGPLVPLIQFFQKQGRPSVEPLFSTPLQEPIFESLKDFLSSSLSFCRRNALQLLEALMCGWADLRVSDP